MLIESIPSKVSIAVPGSPMIDMQIARPWLSNFFYTGMTGLLSRFAFNVTPDFIPQTNTPMQIVGSAVPSSTLIVLVNNINQNPNTVITADPETGAWLTTVLFGPGPNTVVAQYTTPE